jgi:hypothetical protein
LHSPVQQSTVQVILVRKEGSKSLCDWPIPISAEGNPESVDRQLSTFHRMFQDSNGGFDGKDRADGLSIVACSRQLKLEAPGTFSKTQ